MKKLICILACILFINTAAFATFEEHYNLAQQYVRQYQYSSAISEFKKALRINYLDNSARIGLVNSYLARGTNYANNDKNWEAAANDYRAALFYLKYYPSSQEVMNSASAISQGVDNLGQCLKVLQYNTASKSRYQKALELRAQGEFASAGYEFAQSATENALKKESFEQLADIMIVLGNSPKAAEYYQKAVAQDQSDGALRLKYARVLDKLGQSEVAVQEYNYALSKCGDDPETLYALERIYRKKLEQTPDDAEAIANLGAILQKQSKFDEALASYTRASQLNPTNLTTRINIATLYQARKDYNNAISAYDAVLALYPDNVDVNLYKAQCLAATGQKEGAISSYKKVISLDPANKDAKLQMLDLMKGSMTPAQMLAYLQSDSKGDLSTVDTIYDYALELHKQNKLDDAITYYNEVLKSRTTDPEVYVNLAIAYKQKNNQAQATSILQMAKAKFPTNKLVLDNLKSLTDEATGAKFAEAVEYYNKGDFHKALSLYQSVQPPTFDSLIGAAACFKGINNNAAALEFYKKAYAINSTNSDVAYYIGVLYSEKEDWAQAKTYLKKALALNKNNTRAQDLYQSVSEQANIKLVDKAIALYDSGDYVSSLKLINQILAEDSKNSYAYYYRGLIYDVQKKYTLAIVDYKKAIQYNPELTIVNYLIGLDYDSISQFKLAVASYKKYISQTAEENEYKKYAQSRVKALKQYE